MSLLTCLGIYRGTLKDPNYTDEQKEKLRTKIIEAVGKYQSDPQLIKAEYAKDAETMGWLFNRATGKQFDFDVNPITFADVRKFNSMVKTFSRDTGKLAGKNWLNYVKVPKAMLRKFPELAQFQEKLAQESSFYRSAQLSNNSRINDIIKGWTHLAKHQGADVKTLRGLEAKLASEREKPFHQQDGNKINDIEQQYISFIRKGASDVFVDFNALMNGLDVESLGKNPERKYTARDMETWRVINNSMKEVRADGVKILSNGISRIISTAKILESRNMGPRNMESVIRDAGEMLKSLEFQENIDLTAADKKDMKQFGEMETIFGFRKSELGEISQRKYMPLYVIGATKLLRTIDSAIRDDANAGKDLREIVREDIEGFRKGTTRVMSRGNVAVGRYSIDPAYFLKKYIHDVTSFNFTTHLENNYWNQAAKLYDLHTKASDADNQEIMDMSESLIKQMNEIKDSLIYVDPNHDSMVNDISRMVTAITYTRLMGGNLRSAARNATQRLYELVEFGYFARRSAKKWLKEGIDNRNMMETQAKRFGLSWYVAEGSGIFGKSKNLPIEQATRGAIEESSNVPRGYEQNELGELVKKDPSRAPQQFTRKVADVAGHYAGKLGLAHRVVEDWNRAGTFKIGFSLNYQNLKTAPKQWKIKQMSSGKKQEVREPTDKEIERWTQNTAGQMAYNMMSDLHFEYAKWAKAKPFKGPGGQVIGQFMHYRMSMFDLMSRWFKDGMRSVAAGDISSQEAWKMYRFGIMQASIWGMGTVFNTNLQQLAQNDVIESVSNVMKAYMADRSTLKGEKDYKEATYERGWLSFTGPNLVFAADVGEIAGLWQLGDNSYMNSHRIVQGNDNFTRQQKFKSLSLINTQLARFSQYTYPVFMKRGLWDAGKLEMGLFGKGQTRDWFLDKARRSGIPYPTRKKLALTKWQRGMSEGMTSRQVSDVMGSIDYIRGKATPAEVLSNKKRRRKRTVFPQPYKKDVMQSLSFLETF